MNSAFKKFIAGMSLGAGILLAFGGFVFVRAVAPGALEQPFFGPQDEDVTPKFGIECNWTGEQLKKLACNGGSDNGCVGMRVTCANGKVTAMHTGNVSTSNSINCSSDCGTDW
ncbi:MAG: hypothetical protein AAB490_03950 [Patescibacteria group bacterium]